MTKKPRFHYEISFPEFEPSDAIRADIETQLEKLEHLYDRIISCHISVRAPHLHKRKHIYHINLHLEIPGEDIIVNNEPEKNITHSDMHIAIRDAFNALQRQLRKRIKGLKNKSKQQDTHKHAIIKSFDPNQGYGFLKDPTGCEIYFHENALLNGHNSDLKPGSKVRFVEDLGEKGLHVSSMSIETWK